MDGLNTHLQHLCVQEGEFRVYSLLVAHLKLRKEKLLLKNKSPIQRQSLELLVRQLPFQLHTGR